VRAGLLLSFAATAASTPVGAQVKAEEPITKPVEHWLKYREISFTGQKIVLHLRTGYKRPVIFPEPVIVPDEITLADADFTVDIDIVVFSPTHHFKSTAFSVIGQHTGNIYKFAVKAGPTGDRIPLEVLLP